MIISPGTALLRDWRKEDAPSVAGYADSRRIWLNLRDAFPSPYTIDDAGKFLLLRFTIPADELEYR